MSSKENSMVGGRTGEITVFDMGFPNRGVTFVDVYHLLNNPQLSNDVPESLAKCLQDVKFDKIYIFDNLGKQFAYPLSQRVKKPCYPIKKNNRYGGSPIQLPMQQVRMGDQVVLIQDLFANDIPLNAARRTIQKNGEKIEKILLISPKRDVYGPDRIRVIKNKVCQVYDE